MNQAAESHAEPGQLSSATTFSVRFFSWAMLIILAVFLINNFFTYFLGWSGPGKVINGGADTQSYIQAGFYLFAFICTYLVIQLRRGKTLRQDSDFVSDINAYFIRACFWAVLFIGVADMLISFVRVEGLLNGLVGDALATDLGRSKFRGPYVHLPLFALGFVVAAFTRTLGVIWLALLIVAAELAIVITRFIFSYEQAFMGDLVRFWYAALFLFASAYTLLEDAHVRVDVLYAGMASKTKGFVNAVGTIFLGFSVSWTILVIGLGGPSAIINGPLINFEVSQSGFGMYVKYWMAGFLGIFAISMMIQFVSYFLEAVADYRQEPGKREIAPPAAH